MRWAQRRALPLEPGFVSQLRGAFGPLQQVLQRPVTPEALHRHATGRRQLNLHCRPSFPCKRNLLVGPEQSRGLLRRRKDQSRFAVAPRGGGEARDLGREPAVLGQQAVEQRQVARPARFEKPREATQGRGRHSGPRSRAARRMRSAKRTAAATAR